MIIVVYPDIQRNHNSSEEFYQVHFLPRSYNPMSALFLLVYTCLKFNNNFLYIFQEILLTSELKI